MKGIIYPPIYIANQKFNVLQIYRGNLKCQVLGRNFWKEEGRGASTEIASLETG